MIMKRIESVKGKRTNEIRFRFMGIRIRILIGVVREDRRIIGVIYYRIISIVVKERG